MADIQILQLVQKGIRFLDPGGVILKIMHAEVYLQGFNLFLVFVVDFGLSRLAFQAGHLAFNFRNNVVDAQQIVLGGVDFAQRLVFAVFIAGDAGGFFDEKAELFRVCIGDGANSSLLDDGVRL